MPLNLTALVLQTNQIFTIESNKTLQVLCVFSMFLLQGGLAMMYSGLSRARNALTPYVAIIINMFIVLGCIWSVGYTFAWTSGNGFIGYKLKWFGAKMDSWDYLPWILHVCYTMTVVNIGCGGVIERGKPIAYFAIALSIGFFIHPVVVHWAWDNEGWLQTVKLRYNDLVNFRDTGGSCVIHVCAGIVGLVGSLLCGVRKERIVRVFMYHKEVQVMHGHSAPMIGFGGIVVYCGLIALQLSRAATVNPLTTTDLLARVVMNIFIASLGSVTIIFLFACLVNYCNRPATVQQNHFQWPMINATVNGALVGLVSVAAGCDTYYSYFAFVVGVIGALVYMFYSFMMYVCMIDDPADTFAVHFGPGFWGLLAVSIFSRTHGIAFFGHNSETPFLFFAWNLIGGISITAWCLVLITIVLAAFWGLGTLRISKDFEGEGVDSDTFNEFAYPVEAWKRSPNDEVKVVQPPNEVMPAEDVVSRASVNSEKPSQYDTYIYRPESRDLRIMKRCMQGYDHRDYHTYPEMGYEYPYRHSRRQDWYVAPRARLNNRTPYGSIFRI